MCLCAFFIACTFLDINSPYIVWSIVGVCCGIMLFVPYESQHKVVSALHAIITGLLQPSTAGLQSTDGAGS